MFWMCARLRVSLGLAGRAGSQVTTPSDDPRLGLADTQLAPAAVQAGEEGDTTATLKQVEYHQISRCSRGYNMNMVTAL